MKVLGSSLIAALANRRSTLINAGVGFSTFAVGDALSQGARRQPEVVLPSRRQRQLLQQQPSWQQQFVERTRGVDFGRSAKVGLLGIMLNGFALGAWYRVLDRYIGSDRTRIQQVLKKCVVDQFVYAPFSITSFVGYAAVLNGGGPAQIIREAKKNLRDNFFSTWIMDWKVWPAANLIMFRLIPSSYRPSFASMVQVAWQAYMSSVNYDNPHHGGSVSSPASHQEAFAVKAGSTAAVIPTASNGSNGGAVLVRGGGGGEGGTGVGEGGAIAATRKPWQGREARVPAIHTARREVGGVDRRTTGRYAYTPSAHIVAGPREDVRGDGGGGSPSSGILKEVSNLSRHEAGRPFGGDRNIGGGGVAVGATLQTPSPTAEGPKVKNL